MLFNWGVKVVRRALIIVGILLTAGPSHAETVIEQVKPGMGYSQFKQWVIENKLVFENFTKDSITVRDVGIDHQEGTRINIRFCGGDDYAGRATQITVQQYIPQVAQALANQQRYIAMLGGPFNEKNVLPVSLQARQSPNDAASGLAFSYEKDKESWDVGLFTTDGKEALLLQTILKKDSVCE